MYHSTSRVIHFRNVLGRCSRSNVRLLSTSTDTSRLTSSESVEGNPPATDHTSSDKNTDASKPTASRRVSALGDIVIPGGTVKQGQHLLRRRSDDNTKPMHTPPVSFAQRVAQRRAEQRNAATTAEEVTPASVPSFSPAGTSPVHGGSDSTQHHAVAPILQARYTSYTQSLANPSILNPTTSREGQENRSPRSSLITRASQTKIETAPGSEPRRSSPTIKAPQTKSETMPSSESRRSDLITRVSEPKSRAEVGEEQMSRPFEQLKSLVSRRSDSPQADAGRPSDRFASRRKTLSDVRVGGMKPKRKVTTSRAGGPESVEADKAYGGIRAQEVQNLQDPAFPITESSLDFEPTNVGNLVQRANVTKKWTKLPGQAEMHRIQLAKERYGGDYSRYLPPEVGQANVLSRPVDHARFIVARRPDINLQAKDTTMRAVSRMVGATKPLQTTTAS